MTVITNGSGGEAKTATDGAKSKFTIVDDEQPAPVSAKITAAGLRIDPNLETTTSPRLLTKIPVYEKPDLQLYVRVRPGAEWCGKNIGLIKFSRDRRLYAVDPAFAKPLERYYRLHYYFVSTTITGAIFLWVIPMPGEDGSWNTWPQSKYDCAKVAMDRWIQVENQDTQFGPHLLTDPKPDPDWDALLNPCTCLDDVLNLAFASTYVNKWDHPVIDALLWGA